MLNRSASVVTAIVLLTTPAAAYDPCALANLPPAWAWQIPTVPMEIDIVPAGKMTAWCHKLPSQWTIHGCTFTPAMTPNHRAVILLSDALTEGQRVCVLLYEEGHLSPNNWYDPAIENSIPSDPVTGGARDDSGMRTGR